MRIIGPAGRAEARGAIVNEKAAAKRAVWAIMRASWSLCGKLHISHRVAVSLTYIKQRIAA